MTQLFVFTKDDKLLGDFYWDNTIALASALENWASKEGVKITLFSYAIGGDNERWTVTGTNPITVQAGVENKSETQSDLILKSPQLNDVLYKILKTQEKQLFWIRIIGIPFLLAAIGYFIALIIRALN